MCTNFLGNNINNSSFLSLIDNKLYKEEETLYISSEIYNSLNTLKIPHKSYNVNKLNENKTICLIEKIINDHYNGKFLIQENKEKLFIPHSMFGDKGCRKVISGNAKGIANIKIISDKDYLDETINMAILFIKLQVYMSDNKCSFGMMIQFLKDRNKIIIYHILHDKSISLLALRNSSNFLKNGEKIFNSLSNVVITNIDIFNIVENPYQEDISGLISTPVYKELQTNKNEELSGTINSLTECVAKISQRLSQIENKLNENN